MSWAKACVQREIDHGVAAELDDDDLVTEALKPGQRLDEHRGLRGRLLDGCPRCRSSAGVRAVLMHVVVREVVGEDRGGRLARLEVDEQIDPREASRSTSLARTIGTAPPEHTRTPFMLTSTS